MMMGLHSKYVKVTELVGLTLLSISFCCGASTNLGEDDELSNESREETVQTAFPKGKPPSNIIEHRRSVLPAGTPDSIQELKQIQSAIYDLSPKVRDSVVELFANGQHGSGVIVSPDGKIYSAAHVVGGVGTKMRVTKADGVSWEGVSMGRDQKLDTGIARINCSTSVSEYPCCRLASEPPLVGEWVVALGFPGGYDRARGLVFRLGRVVSVDEGTIQTDCKVIGGDSGGPLFNMKGELIGIHSRIGTGLEDNIHTGLTLFQPLEEKVKSLTPDNVKAPVGVLNPALLTIDPSQPIYIPGLSEEDVKNLEEANKAQGMEENQP